MSYFIQYVGEDGSTVTTRETSIKHVIAKADGTGVLVWQNDTRGSISAAAAKHVATQLMASTPSAAEVDRLRRECEALRLHISLMPGGAEYLAAEADYKQREMK